MEAQGLITTYAVAFGWCTLCWSRPRSSVLIGWRDTTANTHSHHTHGHHLYAVVRYGDKSCTTGTCKGGTGTAPFNDELTFQFIEDRHEFDVAVWRKSRLGKIGKDKLIAFGKIRLDDQVLGGRPSRRTWHLHHPPEHGADINAGEVTLEINCPFVQNALPPPAPYGYRHG
ncbi:uncharacterized protein LOC116248336 isoform X3 [Nymphaea colorata]|uniref:uncharacterized protein LOC116248336 isoform X3 n=1 Tax=Nymphaea colorata TaxID=210225 RepID=UPI00129E506A|nr:uncharacterized protein LOC116248336 isoform X3 [Nymphaea colorata]XP_049931608.1 uncharacterized protein LOC116248336 isoform X3 [Nymphaea colorata]